MQQTTEELLDDGAGGSSLGRERRRGTGRGGRTRLEGHKRKQCGYGAGGGAAKARHPCRHAAESLCRRREVGGKERHQRDNSAQKWAE